MIPKQASAHIVWNGRKNPIQNVGSLMSGIPLCAFTLFDIAFFDSTQHELREKTVLPGLWRSVYRSETVDLSAPRCLYIYIYIYTMLD